LRMYKWHNITKKTLANYPPNSIWVEVWHIAFPQPFGSFNVALKSSVKNYRCHWKDRGIRYIGNYHAWNFEELLAFCVRMINELGLKIDDFDFHGSDLGGSEFLREQIKKVLEVK